MTTTALPQTLPECGHDAFRLSHRFAQGSPEHLYWEGVARGMMAAENPNSPWMAQYRTDANRDWLAQPARLHTAHVLANMVPASANRPRIYLLSGLLWGFKEATVDWPNAQVCASCDRRVFPDDDVRECPLHGWVHNDCASGVCDRLCSEEDDF